MAKVIFISGNDGSGKSTLSGRVLAKLAASGIIAYGRHYYDTPLRRLITRMLESKKGFDSDIVKSNRQSGGEASRSIFYRIWFNSAFSAYLCFMALSVCLTKLTTRGVIVFDRSFLDDIVSVYTEKNLPIPRFIIKLSHVLFDYRFLLFATAGQPEEFERITDPDSTIDFHKKKAENYSIVISCIKDSTKHFHEIDTRRKV